MIKTLERAIAELPQLPATDQQQIGRQPLTHVERLRELRSDLDQGIASLDAGAGQPLDIEGFIRRKNSSG